MREQEKTPIKQESYQNEVYYKIDFYVEIFQKKTRDRIKEVK